MFSEHGLYIISDKFFERFPRDEWVSNKSQSRPFYFAIRKDDLLWMIPLTTKTDKIKEKIKRIEEKKGEGKCLYYDVGLIAGIERGFKIGDIFPITEEYIVRAYTIKEKPYVVQDKNLIERIERKAKSFINMVENGWIKSSINIVEIKAELLRK